MYRLTPLCVWRSGHLSQEFEAFAVTLMRKRPVKSAGHILGWSKTLIWWMLFADVKAAQARLCFDNIVWMGVDEVNRGKCHNYLTVIADCLTKRVLLVAPGKHASVWEAFAAGLLRHNGQPKAIQRAKIDMGAA